MSAVSSGSKFHKSWCASSRFSLHCLFWLSSCFPSFFLLLMMIFVWVAKTLGRITKFIKSHEEDHFSKATFKGRGQKNHPSSPLQTINNDWSLTETFPFRYPMQEPIRPHFLWFNQRNNLRGILGEHHLQAFLIPCSPNIPNINGFFRRLINRKWSLFLAYT